MSFSDNALATAERLISKYGDSITVFEITKGAYNPDTGKYDTTEAPEYTKGFVEPINQALVGSGVANTEDITVLLKAPYIDSTYEIAYQGDRYNIVSVINKVSTQDTAIIYKVQCRK